MMKKMLLVLMSLVVALSGGCGSSKKESMPPLSVRCAYALRDSVPSVMDFSCVTHSLYDMDIVPRVSGYLQSVNYEQGKPVKKGQLLLTIEPSEYIEDVAAQNAALASAKAQLVNAENSYNRYLPLSKKRAVSRSVLDEAVAELAEARAAVNSAKASLRNSKTDLSYTKIYAPFDGVIGMTNGAVGEYVGVGTEYEKLNTVSNIDSLYVYLSIPTRKYITMALRDSVRKKMYNDSRMLKNITMKLSNGDDYSEKGCYKFTQRAVDNSTGSVVVHVLFANPRGELRAGEYVMVSAEMGEPRSVILVPARCVMQNQGVSGVFVVGDDNVVKYKKVVLGETFGSNWEILSGVAEGEKVLTEGLQKVHSGEKIIPKMK